VGLDQIYGAILLVAYCMPLDRHTGGQLHCQSLRFYLQMGGQFWIENHSRTDGLLRILHGQIAELEMFRDWEELRNPARVVPRYSFVTERKSFDPK